MRNLNKKRVPIQISKHNRQSRAPKPKPTWTEKRPPILLAIIRTLSNPPPALNSRITKAFHLFQPFEHGEHPCSLPGPDLKLPLVLVDALSDPATVGDAARGTAALSAADIIRDTKLPGVGIPRVSQVDRNGIAEREGARGLRDQQWQLQQQE